MAATPVVFAMSEEIARRPEAVWPFLVDWERLDRWMAEARDFRVVGDRREGVGVVAEATIIIAGISTRDRIQVTRWEPPWILEIAHLGWVRGTGYMEISRGKAGTKIFWREELRPPWGWLGRAGMRLVAPLMHRAFRRDLRLLKELVESGS
jgi:carbon monoxide dehydrogenase subunit G